MTNKGNLAVGIVLMILSACVSCTGQLLWKVAAADSNLLVYIIGFALYGLGALVMMIALSHGELSVLHPILSFGFILSVFLGYFVLNEEITANKIIGIVLIIAGLIFMSIGAGRKNEEK